LSSRILTGSRISPGLMPSKKRRKEKSRAVFNGDRMFRIKKLTELEDANEIYVDVLFPELYDEVLESLRRGIKYIC